MPTTNAASIYAVHPSVLMTQKWVSELKAKTGRSLDEWIKLMKKDGPSTEEKRCDWLRKKYGMGTNTAWWLAERSVGKSGEHADPKLYLKQAAKYVEDLYAGKKSVPRPIHDAIIKLAKKLGKDIGICPCKTMVPVFRNHVIAQIKPSTLTRIDLGFALGPTKASGRLIDTGGYAKKDRISHRIPITSMKELDAEVIRWLKKAYEMDAAK